MTDQLQHHEEEINLLDYLSVLFKRRKLILLLVINAVFFTAIFSLQLSDVYRATGTILPIGSSSQAGIAGLASSLGKIPLMGGAAMGSALQSTPSNKMINIMESRSLAENVCAALDLKKVFFEENWDKEGGNWKVEEPPSDPEAGIILKDLVTVSDYKGLVKIAVEYQDPELAAKIANQYFSTLQDFLNGNALTVAKKKRLFLEERIRLAKVEMKGAEESLRDFMEANQIVSIKNQIQATVMAFTDVKTEIMGKEAQLGVLERVTTGINPRVKQLRDEIAELKKQLIKLEFGDSASNPEGKSSGVLFTLGAAPEIGLQFGRLEREALTQQTIYELLTQQFEMAKIEEAREEISFQLMDPALPPKIRLKPKRKRSIIMAAVIATFLGVFLAFFLEYAEKIKARKTEDRRLAEMGSALNGDLQDLIRFGKRMLYFRRQRAN